MAKSSNSDELKLIRVFNASIGDVWEMWTKDEHAKHWWGPRGFTITTKTKNFEVGGKWIYTMHGTDGVDYPNITTYHIIETKSKLVYDHGGNEERQALFRVTAHFIDLDDKTQLEMTMKFESPELAQEIKKFIKNAGGDTTWDRFAEYIEMKKINNDVFYINRSFEANAEKIFNAWTTIECLVQWMGPTGSTMKILSGKIQENHSIHYEMAHPSGDTVYGLMKFESLKKGSEIIYTQNFCDQNGNLIKPSFAPTWPNSMRTSVILNDEGLGETRVTLKWEIYGSATQEEKKTFHEAKAGMSLGWTGSFDKLEESLK